MSISSQIRHSNYRDDGSVYELRLPIADQTDWEPTHPKLQQIIETGFTTFPVDLENSLLQDTISGFHRFIEKPDSEKADYHGKLVVRGGNVGWRRKSYGKEGEVQIGDKKQFWHNHPAVLELLSKPLINDPETLGFVQDTIRVYRAVAQGLYDQFVEFEEDLPGNLSAFFPDGPEDLSRTNFFHRILSYPVDPGEPGLTSAQGHYDIGAWTIAIAESGPGLRMGIDKESLQSVDRSEIGEGYAVLFTARMLDRIIGKKLPAGWHDVVQSGQAEGLPEDETRWSTVMFIDPYIMPHPDDIPTWNDTHIPVPGGTHRENI